MKLTNEQAQQLQEKLSAQKNPAEAAKIAQEFGVDLSAEDMEQVLGKVSGGGRFLSDDALEKISGGVPDEYLPQIQHIREYYKEKGPNPALILCIFYIPSPICYEIIQVIEEEERQKKKK